MDQGVGPRVKSAPQLGFVPYIEPNIDKNGAPFVRPPHKRVHKRKRTVMEMSRIVRWRENEGVSSLSCISRQRKKPNNDYVG